MWWRWIVGDLVICDLGALEDIAVKALSCGETWWFCVILLRCSAWLVIWLYFDTPRASGVVILLMAPWYRQDCCYNLFEVQWKILICDLVTDERWPSYISSECRHLCAALSYLPNPIIIKLSWCHPRITQNHYCTTIPMWGKWEHLSNVCITFVYWFYKVIK